MIERSEIQFGLTTIPFVIRRVNEPGAVSFVFEKKKLVVTVPSTMRIADVNAAVRRKAPWIVKRLAPPKERPAPTSDRRFIAGDPVLYLGRKFRLAIVEDAEDSCPRIWAGAYEVRIPRGLDLETRRREVRRRLVGSLKEHADLYLPDRLREVCHRLEIDKPDIIVRDQTSWTTFDGKVLRVNWRIVQAPIPVVEHVLLRELIRPDERRETRDFSVRVRLFFPVDEEARLWLRSRARELFW